ncbi:hypothetical protein LOK49_LG09G01996 [Camellia lanceoleosa]|uniref:Uncharacterized protein n=1 Tax=Camellia lanceoleosa TaxID=1840588 RepID=A0ACC0GIA3_9ERIC|nr:hypothetical protein LOK49_LG09G01996 [Camellia lanceoleosa]
MADSSLVTNSITPITANNHRNSSRTTATSALTSSDLHHRCHQCATARGGDIEAREGGDRRVNTQLLDVLA